MNGETRRPLAELRSEIDAIDAELLGLLARRNGVVREVAAAKRELGLPIRDSVREAEILRDRSAAGATMGLSVETVSTLFRAIMTDSRAAQASIAAAESPVPPDRRSVAIVGGRGGMGGLLAGLFAGQGHAVVIADLETEVTPERAAREADVVVVSVPIRVTEDVIRRIGPLVRPDAILMDVTSIKALPLRLMMEVSRAGVVGTHPMFGPTASSLEGQRVVLCPGRGEEALCWVRAAFEARGLAVTEVDAEEHDRAMAIVQVLTHHHTEALGLALSRLGADARELLRFTSPVYLLEAYVTARHFAQAADLYGPIQMLNPRAAEVMAAFREAARELEEIVTERDQARFGRIFEEVSAHFGSFTAEALERSRHLIDRLAELSGEPGRDEQA